MAHVLVTNTIARCRHSNTRPRDDITKVTWKKGDKPLNISSRYTLGDNDKVLTISSLNHTVDDGHYSCAAQNEAGRGDFSAKVHLLVNYKPTVAVNTTDPVVEQHPVTITCQSQEARPAVTSVTWKKGQEVINVTTDSKYSGGTVHTPSLTIGSVVKTDAGEYTCQLGNDVGHGTASVTLIVLYKPYGQATVAPEDVTVAVGGQVSLTCHAPSESGHPTASWFMWSKDNNNFSSNTTDSLRLTPTEVTESGKYRCKAGNWIGQSDHSDWATVTVQAKVEYPRTENIQHSPAFDIADFNMTCTVSGSGDPVVQWEKDGVSVVIGDFTVTSVQVTGGQYSYGQTEAKDSILMWQVTKRARYFTCSNITHFDGNYTCAVSTQTAGATTHDESKAFIVNVQYEAHWSSGPTLTAAAPNDTSKEIVCFVCANPQPTFLWTFKNESLRKGIQVVGNKIILDHVTRDDFGVYHCLAHNSVNGEDRTAVFEVTLVERGPAREPLGFTILSNHTSVALTLQWHPGFHGGHPPQTFTLQYRASKEGTLRIWRDIFSHTTDGVTRYQATVTGLRPQTEYVFSLYAENSRPPAQGPNRSETVSQTGSTTGCTTIERRVFAGLWKLAELSAADSNKTELFSFLSKVLLQAFYGPKEITDDTMNIIERFVILLFDRTSTCTKLDGGEEAHYPPEGSVAAEEREVVINGNFDVKATYKVWLKVYEGGLTVSFQQTKPLDAAVEIDSTIARKFHCGRSKATALIKEMAGNTKTSLAERMRTRPFTQSTDGSDDGGSKQFPLVVRSVVPTSLEVRSDVLSMPVFRGSATGEAIFKLIDESLKSIVWL
ncbi:hypothetical protein NP493_781g00014 [Ridgeia piscesae]|uniref:Uncharacterized protein n=1 Tax=Ridgeia piscesae TaxID=27915 RepID=A0AAD9KNN1_RIDPI|nr:hypothetical protein NP493_781g00014 [Ridgeia piscesae]